MLHKKPKTTYNLEQKSFSKTTYNKKTDGVVNVILIEGKNGYVP